MPRCIAIALGLTLPMLGCNGTDRHTERAGGESREQRQSQSQERVDETSMAASQTTAQGPLDFTMRRIDGTSEHLGAYRGRVVLIVNTASRCGLTPQYEGLQRLHESKHQDGLVVLGFPANDFMGQEPGSNEQIAAFCDENYGVTFPMFEKISVKGAEAHPLFVLLSEAAGEPSWNFTKYLIDREGRIVRRFDPRTSPDDPELVATIEELLAVM